MARPAAQPPASQPVSPAASPAPPPRRVPASAARDDGDTAYPPPPEAARRGTRQAASRQPDPTGAYLDEPPSEIWDDTDALPPTKTSRFSRTRPPKPPGSGPSIALRIFAVAALVLVIVGLWFVNALFQPFKGDGEGQVAVAIPRASGVGNIADILEQKNIVDRAFFFKLRASIAGKKGDLKPGNYVMAQNMSYGDAIDQLVDGPPPPKITKITITEGRSRAEASALLEKTSLTGNYFNETRTSPLLSPQAYGAPKSVQSLEGFLFPATYDVRVGGPIKTLIDQQLATFKNRFNTIDFREATRKKLTRYDVLIIASMIEREAALERERRLIAAVVYNRLKERIPLGIDATIRFATNNWTQPLRQSDLTRPGPYNSRRNKDLPPTPIGNPGIASIRAAANPAKVDFLYYVVKPSTCGEHAFSSTGAQFQRDAERYSSARAARGGKSPTSC